MRLLARAAKKATYTTDVIIRTIDVMQSELTPTGSEYTTLVSAALRSG
jgi:hypothetical protein